MEENQSVLIHEVLPKEIFLKGTFIKRGKRGSALDSFKSEIHKTR